MSVTALVGTLRVKSSNAIVIMYPKSISSQIEGLEAAITSAKIPAPLRNTETYFTANDPVLSAGQFAITTSGRNTNRAKIGDGSSAWSELAYFGNDITLAEYILGEDIKLNITQDNSTVTIPVYDANLNVYVQDSNGTYYLKTSIYTD